MVDYPHNADLLPSNVKKAARVILTYAVQTGEITKPDTCAGCGKVAEVEAHHINYFRPLSVVWLCKPCHIEQHPNQDWGVKK